MPAENFTWMDLPRAFQQEKTQECHAKLDFVQGLPPAQHEYPAFCPVEGSVFMDALHPDRQTQTTNTAGGTVFQP